MQDRGSANRLQASCRSHPVLRVRQRYHRMPHNAAQEMEVRGVNEGRTWSIHLGFYVLRAFGCNRGCCSVYLLLADGQGRGRKSGVEPRRYLKY